MSFKVYNPTPPGDSLAIAGIQIESGAPTSGQGLVYDSVSNQWEYQTPSGGGPTGPTGPTGPSGGPPGPTGPTGPMGPSGGPTGPTGPTGPGGPVPPNAGNAQFGVVEFDPSGDLTETSSNSGIALIKDKAVTNAKLAVLGAASQLKGSASTAPDVTDITLGPGLSMDGSIIRVGTVDLLQLISTTDQTVTSPSTALTFTDVVFQSSVSVTYTAPSTVKLVGPDLVYRLIFTCSSLYPTTLIPESAITLAAYDVTNSNWITAEYCGQKYKTDLGLFGSTAFVAYFTTTGAETDVQIRVKSSSNFAIDWVVENGSISVERLI